jgi:hypothetical protein
LETGTLPIELLPRAVIVAPVRLGFPARPEAMSVLIECEHVFGMTWSLNDFRAAVDLMEVGRSDRQIEELTGIPRGTVGAWRNGRGVAGHRRAARAGPGWRPPDSAVYAYLLGRPNPEM